MKLNVMAFATVAAFAGTVVLGKNEDLQPRVEVVEKGKLVHGSISMTEGSPWCQPGQRMVWLVGHDADEHPSCEVSPGVWRENFRVELPLWADALNRVDDSSIDRHDCGTIYADDDDLPDIVCLVGANKGKGVGYNELFLTQRDGTLKKVLRHGMQQYTHMRTRMMNTLRGPDGTQLVFISTRGIPREDGNPNIHRLFRVTRGRAPYFTEILHANGDPWLQNTVATSVKIGDINGDGLDDIIVTNEKDVAMMFIQNRRGGVFTQINTAGSENWRSVRIADLNGDGSSDLVVTKGYRHNRNKPWLVQVFKGTGTAPYYFNFKRPIYQLELPFPAADVEVLDVNGDGRMDLYVVQADEATENYCGNKIGKPFEPEKWYGWEGVPEPGFVAPKDMAPDLLLMGKPKHFTFHKVTMNHEVPGCGFLAEKFGNDRTMILSHGEIARAGHNVVLEWPQSLASETLPFLEEDYEPPTATPTAAPVTSAPTIDGAPTSNPTFTAAPVTAVPTITGSPVAGIPTLSPSLVPKKPIPSFPGVYYTVAPTSSPSLPSPSLRPVQTATPDTEPYPDVMTFVPVASSGNSITSTTRCSRIGGEWFSNYLSTGLIVSVLVVFGI